LPRSRSWFRLVHAATKVAPEVLAASVGLAVDLADRVVKAAAPEDLAAVAARVALAVVARDRVDREARVVRAEVLAERVDLGARVDSAGAPADSPDREARVARAADGDRTMRSTLS
jgi:hypothetical protein